jgi:hypothetical protein
LQGIIDKLVESKKATSEKELPKLLEEKGEFTI